MMKNEIIKLIIIILLNVKLSLTCLNDLYCNHVDLICKNGMCISKHKREFHEVSTGDICNDDNDCYSENVGMECHYSYYGYGYYYYGKCRYKCRRGQRLLPTFEMCECKHNEDCWWYESCNENYGCSIAWWVYVLIALSIVGIIIICTFSVVFILRACCNKDVINTRSPTGRRKRSSNRGAVYTRTPMERHVSWSSKPQTRTIYP